MKPQMIKSLVEQKVQGRLKEYVLPIGSLLSVIRENPTGARAVGNDGTIWILDAGEYIHVEGDSECSVSNSN